MTEPIVIAAPTIPVVYVDLVKSHLRIDHDDEDMLLESYVAAATRQFSRRTGRTPHETEYETAMDCFPCAYAIRLPWAVPLISITSIKYKDSTGTDTTWGAGNYVFDTYGGRVAPAYGLTWPSFTPYPLSAVRIRYKAGLAITSPQLYVEDAVQVCILHLIGSLYENRESVILSNGASVEKYSKNPVSEALYSILKQNHAY